MGGVAVSAIGRPRATRDVDVDASFGALEIERERIEAARVVPESGLALPLPRADDLVILKAVAGRPRDLADIEALLETHPEIDRSRVRSVVGELAELLEMPEIVAQLERVLGAIA